MPRLERRDLIKQIEEKRGSKVISFVTSRRFGMAGQIQGDVIPLIHDHILRIPDDERSKLDLFLYSSGGNADVPWPLVSMFREYAQAGGFNVLIPYAAHSAATVIALGADEIVMHKKGELGPIDITIEVGPHNPVDPVTQKRLPVSVEDVTAYFDLMTRIGAGRAEEKLKGFELLTNRVPPLVLGTVNRLLEQTKLVAERLLNTRSKPLSKATTNRIIKAISSEVYSHSHAINRNEAINQIGLEFVVKAEDEGLDKEIWNLYEEYRALFELDKPFLPEEYLVSQDIEEFTWPRMGVACIESFDRCDVCRQDVRVKRLRQIPPQVQLNITGLPTINIPVFPANLVTPQDQMAWLQQVINATLSQAVNISAQVATQNLLKTFPQTGFERIGFNSGWVEET